jgi:hypothetical protein
MLLKDGTYDIVVRVGRGQVGYLRPAFFEACKST